MAKSATWMLGSLGKSGWLSKREGISSAPAKLVVELMVELKIRKF